MSEPRPPAERLEEAARALSRFQHDLSNPVAVIAGNVQLLVELAQAEGDAMMVESLRDIEVASERIEAHLRDLAAIRRRMEGIEDGGA